MFKLRNFHILAIILVFAISFVFQTAVAQKHEHSENCSHSKKSPAPVAHKHSADCSHSKPQKEQHVHQPGCSHDTEEKHATHDHQEHDGHENHDHATEIPQEKHNNESHKGHAHEHGSTCSGHDHDADNSGGVELSKTQIQSAKIQISEAEGGKISNTIKLPAEITLNTDNLAHISPKTYGVVKSVAATEGDKVTKGQVLAIIDCPEIGQAKLDYLAAVANLKNVCLQLNRDKNIRNNSLKLLKFLKKQPDLGELKKINFGELGENRSKLIGKYADYIQAKAEFKRQKLLSKKRLASEQELLRTETAYKQASALYEDAKDSVDFSTKQNYLETINNARVAEFKKNNAARKLHILGTDKKILADLEKIFANDGYNSKDEDYFCSSCIGDTCSVDEEQNHKSLHHSDHSLAANILKAPFDGIIISRNAVKGERIEEGTAIFRLANMETVWIDIQIPMTKISKVKENDRVLVSSNDLGLEAYGKISFISPIIDKQTRTAKARITLPNFGQLWKPGTFVSAYLKVSETNSKVIVSNSAIQKVDGESIVFVPQNGGFITRVVKTGIKGLDFTEIVRGLNPGEKYVSNGAFALKATILTSGLDPHAGHGH
jgi:multidrug efflux pump subunit AcrA (membrane-fusion protein)